MPSESTARERAQRIVEEATDRLAAELQAGHSEALRDYLAVMGRFHRYSWTNTVLVHSQRPAATRVAGYHRWRDMDRSVRRGEKGIVIFAPIVGRAKNPEVTSTVLDRAGNAAPREPRGFRAAYVFDVSQTEGKPLPEPSKTKGEPGDYLHRLTDVVAHRGIALTYVDSPAEIGGADGVSSGGEIRLRRGLEPAEEFSVLAHELAHELLHHGPDRAEISKTVRETQAEAVAFVVSHAVGLDTNSAARDYINLYEGDGKTLAESLAAVQHASSQILRELLPDPRSAHLPNEPLRDPLMPEPAGGLDPLEFSERPLHDIESAIPDRSVETSLDR
jgi:hypothetical protein